MAGWLRRIARSALSWETPGSWPALLRDGRTWLIGLTGAGLAVLLAGIAREGWAAGWDLFRVGAFRTGFSDLAVILAGFDCTRLGHDVQLENPCDPFGQRPMNYPRIWLALRASGLGLDDTVWLGTVLGALFVLAALAFLCRRRLSPGEGVLGALILLSPSVLLGVERANGDLLLFLLVLGAAL
ncbi:MAG: hypothetical protein ACRENB_06460, partial [Gemmatimonadales bacterium]